jgi:trk system potassium uptake protein
MLLSGQIKKIKKGLDLFLLVMALVVLASIIIQVGFYLDEAMIKLLRIVVNVSIILLILEEVGRLIIATNKRAHIKDRWLDIMLFLILLLNLLFQELALGLLAGRFPSLSSKDIILIDLGIIQTALFFVLLIKASRHSDIISMITLPPGTIFGISFATIIFIGSVMLMLPKASPAGKHLDYIDALFTSTSAVCVTGLVVVDTGKDFTLLGQIIIMFLIQIGGLGVMTLTTFFASYLAGGISMRMRLLMKDFLSHESMGEISGILFRITLFTFLIELTGVICLYLFLGGNLLHINGAYLYSAVFHSVSAFCNAGFSIYSNNLMESIVLTNYYFSGVIMILIVLGGIGFGVLSNITSLKPWNRRQQRLKYQLSLSTKIVIITTFFLIMFGCLMIYLLDPFKFGDYTTFDKIFHSLFLSVSSRTAGFNTIPIERISVPAMLIVMFLMWVGASPGSTGGGIKTTTFALIFLAVIHAVAGKTKIEIFGRQINPENILKSFYVMMASVTVICISSLLLITFEPDKKPMDLVFEITSAIGTVGLSRNVSPFLGDGGKSIVILVMFIGRIGVLTFFMAFFKPIHEPKYVLPSESVMVG